MADEWGLNGDQEDDKERDPEDSKWLLAKRDLGNGKRLELHRYIFNLRLQLIEGKQNILHEWCFKDIPMAALAVKTWNGEGQPLGYMKDATTGAYNPDYVGE